MMASVFSNPTYQHMVNTNKINFYTMQSNLTNSTDYKLSTKSICISDIMKRISPEVSQQLLSAKSPKHIMNWSLILDEFLPRNESSTNRVLRRSKNCQYKPVVLRNKTPFAQMSPGIMSTQSYHSGEETSTLRLSKAYTLPHNKDTDVLETLPAGDSSVNVSEEEEQVASSPLCHIMRNLLNGIYIQSCLDGFLSSLKHLGSLLPLQLITRTYKFLCDFIMNITMCLRYTIPANSLARLRQVVLVEPIAHLWRRLLHIYSNVLRHCDSCLNQPLLHEVKLNPSPSEQSLQCESTKESLSTSGILSFGRYCNFESLKSVKLKR